MDKTLIYEGSVKNIFQMPDGKSLLFSYTNKYSIFDWGEMPDQLENKGRALAIMGAGFFEFLQTYNWNQLKRPTQVDASFFDKLCSGRIFEGFCRNGLSSHYFGHLNDQDQPASGIPVNNTLLVKKVDVHRPTWTGKSWDYWKYQKHPNDSLVPLEVIFRFGLPAGSSFMSRANDVSYLESLGLYQKPAMGQWLPFPVIEFSTKLESTDRYLNYTEAQEISGMSGDEFKSLLETAQLAALALFEFFISLGIELWDGKFEFAFSDSKSYPNRELLLVDSIGPDELRLLANNIHLSKEFLRQAYRGTKWYEALGEAKKKADLVGDNNWKKYCSITPDVLQVNVKNKAENIYKHLANEIAQRVWRVRPFNLGQNFSQFLSSLGVQ